MSNLSPTTACISTNVIFHGIKYIFELLNVFTVNIFKY